MSGDSGPGTLDDTGPETGTTDATSTGTTGDPTVGGRASLILRDDLHTPGLDELFRVDWIEGQPTEPLAISGPVADGIAMTALLDEESKLFYRAVDSVAMASSWHYVPLEGGVAGSVSQMNQPPAPALGAIGVPELFQDASSIAYYAAEDTAGTNEAIYIAPVTTEAVEAPVVAVTSPPAGEALLSAFRISTGGTWLSYAQTVVGGGPTNAWITPIMPVDPAAAVQVSDLDQPGQSASAAAFVPGDQAVWYRADRDIDQVNEIFLVDISGPTPAPPVKVNDPLMPGQDLLPTRLSPDGSRLAYFVGENLHGDVWLVTFEGTTASMPVEISTLGDGEASPLDLEWSPDGAWLTYSAEHEQPDTLDLYLVDMTGAEPSAPMLVTQPGLIAGGGITALAFHPSGTWLYIIAQIDSETPELYRSDLSSGIPGELQKVSGEVVEGGVLPGTIVFSHDGTHVLYHASQDDPDVMELYMVDVSGATPGASQKVNGPLPAGENVSYFAQWSGDDSAILYLTQTDPQSPLPLHIVARDALGSPALIAEDPAGAIVLDTVP